MKKGVCLIISVAIVLSFCGCSNAGARIGQKPSVAAFTSKANISIGDMSYDCVVDYLDGAVTVTALSSNVSGLSLTYNGSELAFDYEGMKLSFSGDNADIVNPAVEIYNALTAVNAEAVNFVLTESGYKADGESSSGRFTVAFDKENNLSSLEIKNANIYVKFKAPS